MQRFSAESLKFTLYLAISLLIAMTVREYVRAVVAARLHDPTPRLWGRLTFNPKAWFDPFGSGLLPGLTLLLWAAASGFLPPPVAYGKPAPIDPSYFRTWKRDSVVVGFAGPVANIVVGSVAGLVLRATPVGELGVMLGAFMFTNYCLAIFHLLPIPGLDGARLVGLLLPPRAREVYRNADQYLPLFVLGVIFLLAGPVQSIVYSLTNAMCEVSAGIGCRP